MGKELSEMTLEELWQLFPIVLTEHQDCWKDWYEEEEMLLHLVLGSQEYVPIHHIGSTAIANIYAKPIIDILIELPGQCSREGIKAILARNGYLCMSESEDTVSFNKGYTKTGFADRVYHVHVHSLGDHDEVYFRDYLNEHPQVAKEYEALKLELWKQYEHNRDAYTNAKTEFVTKYTKLAKEQYID